jgi:hypothetical protein
MAHDDVAWRTISNSFCNSMRRTSIITPWITYLWSFCILFLYLVSIFTRHLSCNIKPCSSIIGSCLTRESPLYTDTSIENDGLAPVLLIMRTVAAGRTINICLVGGQTFRVPSGAEYVPFNFATGLFLYPQLLLLVFGTSIINRLNGASWLVYRNANLFPRYRRAWTIEPFEHASWTLQTTTLGLSLNRCPARARSSPESIEVPTSWFSSEFPFTNGHPYNYTMGVEYEGYVANDI